MPLIDLRLDRLRAAIDPELGASLVSFTLDDPGGQPTPLMRPTAPGETDPGATSMFLMAPWTNRIAGGSFRFAGREVSIEPNFPDGTAIHGFARDRAWRITDRTPHHAALEFDSRDAPLPGWPWPYIARARYELEPGALSVDLSVRNAGDDPMPAGLGWHPFFPRRLWSDRDEVRLRAPVTGRYPCVRQLPTGAPAREVTTERLSSTNELGDPGLDDVYTASGDPCVIEWPASGVTLTMRSSEEFTHLVVFTPRDDAGPRSIFCVEPCTMANDAFNLADRGIEGVGVRTLKPGETLAASTRFEITAEAP